MGGSEFHISKFLKTYWDRVNRDKLKDINQEVFEKLLISYNEDGRFYHDIYHIADCLDALTEFDNKDIKQWGNLCMALFYHDVVYKRSDNSTFSSELESSFRAFDDMTLLNKSIPDIAYVTNLILATEYSKTMNDPFVNINKTEYKVVGSALDDLKNDILIMRDIDLKGFSNKCFITTIRSGKGIVEEYRYMGFSDEEIYKGRVSFLESIDTENLYKTEYMKRYYSKTAKFNISTEVDLLRFKGLSIYDKV